MSAPLRVGVTVEQLWQPVPGGSGTYITQLLESLARGPDVEPVGLAAAHRPGPLPDGVPDIPVRSLGVPRRLLYEAWNRWRAPRPEWLVHGLDVVHATTWAVPPTRRPLVVTVHDLAFLRDPSHFTPHGVAFFTRALRRTLDEAAAVIVPSRATAVDVVEAGFAPDRVHVVPHGAPGWTWTADELATFRSTHSLPDRFVLWCGTFEPRKNLGGLLEAFSIAADADPDLHLVLVGPRGWGERPAAPKGPWTDRVHELGRLSTEDLRLAYVAARALAFPSFWEGFGLPVLEAMSVGTPVVTSRETSMAEVAGVAGVLVDPRDPDALAAGILRAVGPEHDALAAAALRQATIFTWDAAAEATAQVYRSAAGPA